MDRTGVQTARETRVGDNHRTWESENEIMSAHCQQMGQASAEDNVVTESSNCWILCS